MIRFVVISFMTILISAPSYARDDGGFGGSGFSQKAPTAFSDPSPQALAKYQDPLNPSLIEPASGDSEQVKPTGTEPMGVIVPNDPTQQSVPSLPLPKISK